MICKSRVRNGVRLSVVAMAALQLAACATAAKPEAMVVTPTATAQLFPQGLQHAMCVRAVTGGQKTNALWVSKVDDQSFQTALTNSLAGAGLTAPALRRWRREARCSRGSRLRRINQRRRPSRGRGLPFNFLFRG